MRIIFTLVRIIAGVLIIVVLVSPLKKEVDNLKLQQKNLSVTQSDAKQYATLGQDVVNRYQSLDPSQIQRLKKMVPDAIDTVRLINDVNGIAKSTSMTLKKVDYNPEEIKKGGTEDLRTATENSRLLYGSYSIRFAVVGSYKNFLSFVEELENSLRILDITNISFSSNASQNSPQDVYEYTITAKTYWLRN